MTLHLHTVTSAQRLMLPIYGLLFTALGVNYLVAPRSRLTVSPALDYADQLAPLPVWGGLFLFVGLGMWGALLTHGRRFAAYVLWFGMFLMGIWTLTLIAAAILNAASWSACCWPAFVATCCYATQRSLLAREV